MKRMLTVLLALAAATPAVAQQGTQECIVL